MTCLNLLGNQHTFGPPAQTNQSNGIVLTMIPAPIFRRTTSKLTLNVGVLNLDVGVSQEVGVDVFVSSFSREAEIGGKVFVFDCVSADGQNCDGRDNSDDRNLHVVDNDIDVGIEFLLSLFVLTKMGKNKTKIR